MSRVLIVDDDADIVAALRIYLSSEGYELLSASTGQQALDIIDQKQVDLVLMDIMMPEMDGIAATAKLRSAGANMPIILLTAKSEDSDKLLGLNIGADDYITKPFSPAEVVARVRSSLRRYTKFGSLSEKSEESHLNIGGIVLDDSSKSVTVDDASVSLTPMEYGILKMLMSHPGKVYSSEQIYRQVWKDEPIVNDGVVAVHIRHLREKIEITPSEPRYLKVVWGQGYKMEDSHK
ncbi:MAG: response regulator transcription factor [Erysipelotrichia bacterium]|nr:response regulator transcription factor [Erysipelotrichia bacterium]